MAPPRRKKGTSPTASASPVPIPQLSPSRLVVVKTPMKSPLRQVRLAGVTKNQKMALIENLDLELTERVKKLRSQCAMQAQALKQRIEMRINRVPKKLWDVTMGELLAQHGSVAVPGGPVSAKLNASAVKELVEDVKRLSEGEEGEGGGIEDPQSMRPLAQKKRITKNTSVVVSAREQMPPPPIPAAAKTSRSLALSPSKPGLPSTSALPSSSTKVNKRTVSKAPARVIKNPPSNPPSVASSSRSSSRATTRSSLDASPASAEVGQDTLKRGAKGSQSKPKTAAAAMSSELKRGGVKATGSNGSLKENRVEGIRKEGDTIIKVVKRDTSVSSSGGRVLRSRK